MSESDGDVKRESVVVTAVTEELSQEFGDMPTGRVLAVVARCVDDLRRVAVTTRTAASIDDFSRGLADMARRRLRREAVVEPNAGG